MKRRQFIRLIGSSAFVWSKIARAGQAPVIGFLHSGALEQNIKRLAAWRGGLNEAGFVEGDNVAINFHWAAGRNDELPAFAADLIGRHVAVIATPGSTQATLIAKNATMDIPIVFAMGADPVALGVVDSLNRPGGNITGVTSLNTELTAKRLGLFRQLMPRASYFMLVNPTSSLNPSFIKELDAGAVASGIRVDIPSRQHRKRDQRRFCVPGEPAGQRIAVQP